MRCPALGRLQAHRKAVGHWFEPRSRSHNLEGDQALKSQAQVLFFIFRLAFSSSLGSALVRWWDAKVCQKAFRLTSMTTHAKLHDCSTTLDPVTDADAEFSSGTNQSRARAVVAVAEIVPAATCITCRKHARCAGNHNRWGCRCRLDRRSGFGLCAD